MAAVPLNQTNRPDSFALEAIDRFARGQAGISDTRTAIEICLAAGDWTGHEEERRRFERLLEAPPGGWDDVARRWREVYQIPDPLA